MDKSDWNAIKREELLALYRKNDCTDGDVARLFGVTKGQVAYKRKKLGISRATIMFQRFISQQDSEIVKRINEDLKHLLLEKDVADLSKAIVHYVFRNGPVEDMHANGQLSDADMKTLNQYMNNRVATLLYLLKEQDFMRLALFFDSYQYYGTEWDEPELQLEELDKVSELLLELKGN